MSGQKGSGSVVWVTGLSGSGKTSLALELASRMRRSGRNLVLLDGDELRKIFGPANASASGFRREARLDLAMRYSRLCRMLSSQGTNVVISTISLFKEVHEWNRANLPCYFEVYLKVPLEELRRRDPKGLYRRYDAGEIKEVVGLDLPMDEPDADFVVEFTAGQTVEDIVRGVMSTLKERGFA